MEYINHPGPDIPHPEVGTPDYSDLPLSEYLSVIEVLNPMHRLWSDGRWNKLTIAHGCYWKRCSFCDVTLDYIGRYETAPATLLVDRIEQIVAQTGQTGFHFVDEAAPPLALRDLAVELLKRRVNITWWGNIRFEKTFSPDLCRLLAASGCIAVSGGLEVASDRLLALMEKGVTIAQVARVTDGFTQAGIMVHAYLMYGFPTETAQETVDSLEVVRQLFQAGIVQSGYWHRFSMTAHSPVGKNPAKYKVAAIGPEPGPFAWNDLWHDDPTGTDHEAVRPRPGQGPLQLPARRGPARAAELLVRFPGAQNHRAAPAHSESPAGARQARFREAEPAPVLARQRSRAAPPRYPPRGPRYSHLLRAGRGLRAQNYRPPSASGSRSCSPVSAPTTTPSCCSKKPPPPSRPAASASSSSSSRPRGCCCGRRGCWCCKD